ncbi:MAG: TRAP transporter substrate-binding protein [Rhodospirillaceae bacterium]
MSDAVLNIRAGGYQGPASVHTRAMYAFGEALKAELGDAVTFDFTESVIAEGLKAAELLRRVEDGRLTICYFSASYLADRVAEIALLDMPFTFTDRANTYAIVDGPLGRRLADLLAANTGYRLLSFWDNGFRHLSNGVRPIRTPDDCKGLTIRTLFSELHRQVFAALGFEPVPLDVAELVDACKTGRVTAQENPLTNTYNFGIHEFHPYITLSTHFFGPCAFLCNADAYASWTDAQREAVGRAAAHATAVQRGLAAAEDAEMLAKLAETDVQVVELTAAERAAFAAAVAPVTAAQREKFGDELFGMLGGA